MTVTVRRANPIDHPGLLGLLADASEAIAASSSFWSSFDRSGGLPSATTLARWDAATGAIWFVAEIAGRPVGMTRAMMLPVPPIYAAALGPPALLLDECHIAADAPPEIGSLLLRATEAALREAGAALMVASSAAPGRWREVLDTAGYRPTTLYLGKVGSSPDAPSSGLVRPAGEADLPDIVAASATCRTLLMRLNRFWIPHAEADARFGGWMRHSLTLADRDMVVGRSGYIVVQPVSPLLLPAAFGAGSIGVIDDFFNADLADEARLAADATEATALLEAAEAAFARRGVCGALAVCPAAWRSKADLLHAHGYRLAKQWMIKS